MTAVTHYDLVIIGTGSGNSIVDDRFADWSVAIVEEGTFGGTCLNVGCIPTKMFVYPADTARATEHNVALGVDGHTGPVHWEVIRDRVFGRIDPIAAGGKEYREGLPNVTVYTGHAVFTAPRTLRVTLAHGREETISADQVVIAAGSRVHLPDFEGLAETGFHTSDTVMRLPALPTRMGIVGGGFVAAEFAHVFSAYGVAVTQVHRGGVLLGREDAAVAERFTRIARRQWDVRLRTTVTRVVRHGEAITMTLDGGGTVEVDTLLIATGRVPNGDRLDVAAGGVATDEDGVVVVDEHQHTSAEGVWALGDVANHHQLKHVANHEARVVQHNLLHPDDPVASDHRFVPSAVFTSPQVASVGLTEVAARARGGSVVAVVQRYADVAYGWAMAAPDDDPDDHVVKLVADAETGLILGAHLIGPQASNLIQPLIQAMSLGQDALTVARGQYWIHPALAEVVENALLGVEDARRAWAESPPAVTVSDTP